MATDHRTELARIHRFDQLIRYLRDEMGWPIASDDFEELTFDYTAEELGINAESAAKIQEIKRLRPLSAQQPWGIFFVKFEPKSLPVVALRRILSQVALKKRASANSADRAGWAADDLLFVSNYGQDGERKISFAHFARPSGREDLPTLKVLGWDNQDTPLHLDAIARELTENLAWPQNENDVDNWRKQWRSAFTLGHREVITTAELLSIRLAELAGAIRDRIRSAIAIESPRGPLTRLMKAFQEFLVHDLDAEGFADMYAQTISYGLLSSRIADPSKKTADDFAAHMRTSPFLRELMQTFLKAGGRNGKSDGAGIDFDELGVADVVELLDGANMEAVVRDFGDKNPQEDPVIHFYELFLKKYDAKKRMSRGVFYTPRPVVSFIVRSVDELLRTKFDLPDGLADTTTWGEMVKRHSDLKIPEGVLPEQDFVQILDPATGTGTFLVEVIDLIHKTLVAKWKAQGHAEKKIGALWNEYVPKHLLPRLHGYELLMAPYAIAHLKIGLKLHETGYHLCNDERARVYLTSALEPAADKQMTLDYFPALAHEAEAVNVIKRDGRFTAVVGNPPYSSVSQNMTTHIWELVNEYLVLPAGPIVERSNRNHLQDDYVKFVRVAQACIAASGVGLIGMITNSSYLSGTWYRGMRFHLLKALPWVDIIDLHGGKGFIRSAAFDDQNVFEIMQSVAIAILACTPSGVSRVSYSELIGSRESKYERLLTRDLPDTKTLHPSESNKWSFQPFSLDMQSEWESFIRMEDVFVIWGDGAKTNRDGLAVARTSAELRDQIQKFADLRIADATLEEEFGFGSNYQWKTETVRRAFSKLAFDASLVSNYAYRPFDTRFIYWHPAIVFNMRGGKLDHFRSPNPGLGFLFSRTTTKDEYTNFFVTRSIPDMQILYNTKVAPLFRAMPDDSGGALFAVPDAAISNLGAGFVKKLACAVDSGLEKSPAQAEIIFSYVYATVHSRIYRRRYQDFLRTDYPRIPLPGSTEFFRKLARLGGELIALHLLEAPKLDKPITEFVGSKSLEVEKISWLHDTVWLDKAQTTGFKGVPEDIWNFYIGGYQVCEKWLKDRKGSTLSKDDIAHYQKIIVALSETIRLMGEIDSVIEKYGGWPDAFLIN